jgi:hypothetical protein
MRRLLAVAGASWLLLISCGARTDIGGELALGDEPPTGATGTPDGSSQSAPFADAAVTTDDGQAGFEGGFFFTQYEDASDDASDDALDDGSAAADGSGCGPATCTGCCSHGVCDTRHTNVACGHGGEACYLCDPEHGCGPTGQCQ